MLAIIKLAFVFADLPLSERKLFSQLDQLDSSKFNSKLDFLLSRRKKYLMVNLRFPGVVNLPTAKESFQAVYSGDRWLQSSLLFASDRVCSRVLNHKAGLLDCRNLALIWLNHSCLDVGVGFHLTCIAIHLGNRLLEQREVQELVSGEPRHLSLGIIMFLMKLFYSIGIDSPSMVTCSKLEISKHLQNSAIHEKMLELVEFLEKKIFAQEGSPLLRLTRNLPSFQSLFEK